MSNVTQAEGVSKVTLDEFLAAFFSDRNENFCLATFQAKGAPFGYTRPARWDATRADLMTDETQRQVSQLNEKNGIYFIVNSGGQKDEEITRYNAFFVERDSGSLAEQHAMLDAAPIQTSARLETFKSVHAYWLVAGDCTEEEWREIQARLIAYFDGDKQNKNPSRCMRLPHFNHVTYNGEGEPLTYKRVEIVLFDAARRYTVAEMLAAFPAPKVVTEKQPEKKGLRLKGTITDSRFASYEERHAELKRLIMAHPTAKRNERGIFDCKGVCHDGEGGTALMFNPATNAVYCNNGCDYSAILRAFGLPDGYLPPAAFAERGNPRPPEYTIHFESAGDLLARDFPEPKWAVDGLLSEGATVFAGSPKAGKSWLALGLALSVSSGRLALGSIPVLQGDVLYLALEDGARRMKNRLQGLLNGGNVPERLTFTYKFPLVDEGGLEAIEGWLQAHPEARLVVVDTLKRIRPLERKLKRIYDNDYDAVSPLNDLALKYGVAVLIVHHTNKLTGNDDWFDSISGSLGLLGAVDNAMLLRRPRSQQIGTLYVGGRDIDDKELEVRFDGVTAGWRLSGDALSPLARKIRDWLNVAGPDGLSRSEINKKNGNRADGVDEALAELRASELAVARTVQTGGRPQERWIAVQFSDLCDISDISDERATDEDESLDSNLKSHTSHISQSLSSDGFRDSPPC